MHILFILLLPGIVSVSFCIYFFAFLKALPKLLTGVIKFYEFHRALMFYLYSIDVWIIFGAAFLECIVWLLFIIDSLKSYNYGQY